MNKKVLIFSVYCVIIIVALILFLVFFPNISAHSSNDSGDNIQIDSPISDQQEDSIIYATDLILNCPRSITLTLGESVELLGEYIYVEPSDSYKHLSYTITGRYGSNAEGITFEDNIIKAIEKGNYYIKFSIPSSETESLSDGITISVVEDNNTTIIQTLSIVEIGNEYNINTIFTFNTQANKSIQIDNPEQLILNEDTIIPQSAGEAKVVVSLIYEYIKYDYTFTLQVKDKPQPADYKIQIYSIPQELETGKTYAIEYEVIDKNGVTAFQYIRVESSDSDKVEIMSYDHPLIYVKCKEEGEVTIKITYLIDESITKEIKLTVS